MRRLILLTLTITIMLTGCSLLPEPNRFTRRAQTKAHCASLIEYGWYGDYAEEKCGLIAPELVPIGNQSRGPIRMYTMKVYSSNSVIRRLQKMHLWPVERRVVFGWGGQ